MKVSKKQAEILHSAIAEWHESKLIGDNLSNSLNGTIEVVAFDWARLAKYSFWVSIACIFVALMSVVTDRYLVNLLKAIFNATHVVRCTGLTIISGVIYWYSYWQRQKYPDRNFSNEARFFLGVLTTAGAVYELCRTLGLEAKDASEILLISYGIYALIGYMLRSKLIWAFSLLAFGGWLGAKTGYMSGWGAYCLGMNYPLRFALLGLILTVSGLIFEKNNKLEPLSHTTFITGLLYLFIALWILSIFGNYGDIKTWVDVKQIELFHWSILFAACAGGAICHGLRFDNSTTKAFGVTFLFINLYTRYFEFFWNATHKAVFFAILAISFWFLGKKSEKIMQLVR